MDEDKLFDEAFKLWFEFKSEIIYKNRYFTKHKVVNIIEKISQQKSIIVEPESLFYRARIFTDEVDFLEYSEKKNSEDDDSKDPGARLLAALNNSRKKSDFDKRKESGFWGYDIEDSFVPSDRDKINEGRANPKSIAYLYTAYDEYTAMVEIRPFIKSLVSIAAIKNIDELRIADFTSDNPDAFENIESIVLWLVSKAFSRPVNGNTNDYIPTQYISEFIKSLGFDGIKFDSSLSNGGKNLTIFCPEKCKVASSKLVRVNNIYFEGEELAPSKGSILMHERIKKLSLIGRSLPCFK